MGGSGAKQTDKAYESARSVRRAARRTESLASDPNLVSISQGNLTPYEQQQYQTQLDAINAGYAGAEQATTQGVRENAAARGLFSSSGAIGEEAARLGNLRMNYYNQLGGLYGQRGMMSRQGILSGMQLRSGIQQGGVSGFNAAAGLMAQNQAGQQNNLMQGMLGAGQLATGMFTMNPYLMASGGSQLAGAM